MPKVRYFIICIMSLTAGFLFGKGYVNSFALGFTVAALLIVMMFEISETQK